MNTLSAEEALALLKEGNARYVAQTRSYKSPIIDAERRLELEHGQSPFAIVLGCADSRVVPEYVFDQGLGDVFSVLVAGNVANPSSMASIEYAVANLGTKLIVVLGHESCGACGAAIKGGDNGPNLNHLLAFIQKAVDEAGPDVNAVVQANAKIQMANLTANSAIIEEWVRDHGVQIVPAYYNLVSGAVEYL